MTAIGADQSGVDFVRDFRTIGPAADDEHRIRTAAGRICHRRRSFRRQRTRAPVPLVGLADRGVRERRQFLQGKLPDVPSCLVLDVRLPGQSGFDFQTELAKANILIPIIFMTGHGDIPMTVRAMKGGAIDFLAKPFRDQDMLDAVAIAIDRDRERREAKR